MPNVLCSAPPSPLGNAEPNQLYQGGYSAMDNGTVLPNLTMEAKVTIAMLTGGGNYDSGWLPVNMMPDAMTPGTGMWNVNIDVQARRGTGAAFRARLLSGGVEKVSGGIEDFSVLSGIDMGGIHPIPLLTTDPGLAKRTELAGAAYANPPAGFTFKIFTGTYPQTFVPPITRITCRIERHYDGGMGFIRMTKSIADALVVGGLWAVIILVPTPLAIPVPPASRIMDDFLFADMAAANGYVWTTAVQKLT